MSDSTRVRDPTSIAALTAAKDDDFEMFGLGQARLLLPRVSLRAICNCAAPVDVLEASSFSAGGWNRPSIPLRDLYEPFLNEL